MGDVGNMDRRVSLQIVTNSKTAGGAPQKTFAHSFYAWCSRSKVGDGGEQYSNDRLVLGNRYKYKTHTRSDINETMRLVDGSVTYNILAVDQAGLFIEILVERVV